MKKRTCFRRNKKTGEITSFHFPLKNLSKGECDCAKEMLWGFAREAKAIDSLIDNMPTLWEVIKELENGNRTKERKW